MLYLYYVCSVHCANAGQKLADENWQRHFVFIDSFSMVDVCVLGMLTKVLFLHAHSQISIHMTLPKTSYLHLLVYVF